VRSHLSEQTPTSRWRWVPAAGPWARKLVRYSLVSLVSVAVSQTALMVAFGMLHWTARTSNIAACTVATLPSYYLNRTWAWGRHGRSHLWREVVPFWALAFLGLAFSTWAADLGSSLAQQAGVSHKGATLIVMTAALAAFGILWVGKFVIFNAMLFAEPPQHLRAASDRLGRGDLARVGGSVRLLAIAATAGVLLLGGAGLRSAAAQEQPSDTTVPPSSEPATTAPPTTLPPTTTLLPSTTQAPATTRPTASPPSTTPAVGAGGTTTTFQTARGTASTASPAGAQPFGSQTSLPSDTTSGAGATGTSGPQPLEPARRPAAEGSAVSQPNLLRRVLRDGAAQLPRHAVEEATSALRKLSPAELGAFLLLGLFSTILTVIGATTLWWMLHAWRTPQTLAETGFRGPAVRPRLSFSLIVPARHEEVVLGETLARLAASDHPAFEILVVVGHDDPATAAVAERASRRHPGLVRVLVDTNRRKNKPKALNTVLPACRGDVVGVFDAEDEVHPQLLRHVDARFTDSGADVVQGGVQLMNFHSSWYAVRNVLEYYFWFRSRLHFHAQQRFIPLGGNTVFVRTDLLRRAGGWDPDCLAEDCELGVRLSSRGARVAVAYDPMLVTREETPASVRALLKQRTRWNQGFLQVLRKGEWRRLPTRRQRLLARYTLAMPFLQAIIGVLIPLSLAATVVAKAPVLAALLTFVPLLPALAVLVAEAAGLGDFCRSYRLRTRWRDYLRLLLGALPYHVLLAVAAIRAVLREARGNRSWEKTAHVGAHRTEPATAVALEPWASRTNRTA
jgi:cellulose synthase/poly-beta-1,6-N-acetylglucosamine synthase-like glycosyltransferase/putative flippase GtrA